MLFSDNSPKDNRTLREEIYAGAIFKYAPTPASLETVVYIKEALAKAIDLPLESVHERLTEKEFSDKMRQLRLMIVEDKACMEHVRNLMSDFGFAAGENAFDFLRLRSVLHNGHLNPALERAYSLHRDTWYANPQCQINWWIALHDVPEERAFSFYPSYFRKKIENTSGQFDYNDWISKVGWQSTRSPQAFDYPRALQRPEGGRETFFCRAGEIILFSAAHLHQTNPNTTGLSRFSIDFRTVHMEDHRNNKGALNIDNGSIPDALRDYVLPEGYGQ